MSLGYVFGDYKDERYVVGTVIYGLYEIYKTLPEYMFEIEQGKRDENGNPILEQAVLPTRVTIVPAWSNQGIDESGRPLNVPLIVVNASFSEVTPYGFGTIYKQDFIQSENSDNSVKGQDVFSGIHILQGTLMITPIAGDLNTLRSLRSKLLVILRSEQFVKYAAANGINILSNFRVENAAVEDVQEQVKYFYSVFPVEFVMDWSVGSISEDRMYSKILDAISFAEKASRGEVYVNIILRTGEA